MKNKVLILIAATVLIAAGIGLFVMTKDDDTSEKTVTNTSTSAQDHKDDEHAHEEPSIEGLKDQHVGEAVNCSLYTFSELETVWGVPFTDTDVTNVQELSAAGGKQYSCDYNERDDGLGVTFIVEYSEYPDVASAEKSINDTKSTEKFDDEIYFLKEDVAEIGDEAFFWTRNRTDGSKEVNQQLYIRNENVVFLLSGVNLDGVTEDYKDKLVASYKLHFE